MIQKLTLTKIYRSDKDKNGKLLVTKDGRAYSKIAVKTKEYGDKFISGFSSYWNKDWVEGQVVGAVVEPNGDFLNLKKPDPIAELEEKLTKRILVLEQALFQDHHPQSDDEPSGHVEDINGELMSAREKKENLPF